MNFEKSYIGCGFLENWNPLIPERKDRIPLGRFLDLDSSGDLLDFTRGKVASTGGGVGGLGKANAMPHRTQSFTPKETAEFHCYVSANPHLHPFLTIFSPLINYIFRRTPVTWRKQLAACFIPRSPAFRPKENCMYGNAFSGFLLIGEEGK